MITWYSTYIHTERKESKVRLEDMQETKTTKKLFLPFSECAQAVTAREGTHTPDKSLLASKNHMTYLS